MCQGGLHRIDLADQGCQAVGLDRLVEGQLSPAAGGADLVVLGAGEAGQRTGRFDADAQTPGQPLLHRVASVGEGDLADIELGDDRNLCGSGHRHDRLEAEQSLLERVGCGGCQSGVHVTNLSSVCDRNSRRTTPTSV